MIKTCPRCELRFASVNELEFHLATDHPDTAGLERLRYPAVQPAPPLYPDMTERRRRRRYLVLADQTLHAGPLRAEVVRRHARGPCEFVVCVPATHTADYPVPAAAATAGGGDWGMPGPAGEPDQADAARARSQLRVLVDMLRAEGVVVRGELGGPDPYAAAGAVLEREHVDEVLLAMRPPSLSRQFGTDLERRLRRHWNVPVTAVVAES